jgi:integrase
MASIYHRADSNMIWIRRKRNGRWVGERTNWKVGDRAGERKARALAAKYSLEDLAEGTRDTTGEFSQWVPAWLLQTYGGKKTRTYDAYQLIWSWLARWMDETGRKHPQDITRESLSEYRAWRSPREGVRRKGAGTNTIIGEVRFLGRVLKEARLRGYCKENVARELGWSTEDRREYEPWTDEEIATALKASEKLPAKRQWIRVALILGVFQAARLSQTRVKLSALDLEQGMIFWPKEIMKGKRRDWVQPLDPRAVELLRPIIAERRAAKKATLADMPDLLKSMQIRKFLDDLGISKVHHGLRSTWITKAALSGVPQAAAMAYVHHAGDAVHRIYQRVKPSQTAEFLSKISFGSP